MTAVSREKIALVVFALLVLVGIGSLVAYLNIGHSWNVTASQIDDATGELEGYTAILYAGTALAEERDEGEDSSGRSSRETEEEDGTAAEKDAEGTSVASSEGAATTSSAQDDGEDGTGSYEGGMLEESGSRASSSESSSSASARTAGGATPLFNSALSSSTKEKEPVTVEEAAESYREKQATVFTLDTTDLAKYSEGMILKKGERRFGVFSVLFNEPLPSVQRKVDYLAAHEVDFIVAITPDRAFVEQATGIDLVISLQNEGISFMGETVNGTFYVDSPLTGEVGAILISPHNVVSAKDITEL